MKTSIAFATVFAATLLTFSTTRAGESIDGRSNQSLKVYFADLDLSREEGAATLLNRIKAAASHVCKPMPVSRALREMQDYNQCLESAIQNAVTLVDRPALTQYVARTKQADKPIRVVRGN